jgi:hypothetical protein
MTIIFPDNDGHIIKKAARGVAAFNGKERRK